ncbi:copper amine oxidase N-terminal domain-containing protein [Ammoniphilus resinae]|uniref:Vacuolar-type H+-ATPase subunit I/STV1 n=1 Tax=Ammoniphilus resinae TaxID=861532 RepID=A0ABS4GQN7_9BACL|nr:copper amine oxidase N-terminal domain-containing protein [Ammoniphilus resinae]MBP1932569.1 vacuolar-type H+-ATPase subunit I/STV1 [Ammoniphilus resinae]
MKNWRKVTFGVLAASLLMSQSAFADQPDHAKNKTKVESSTEASVTSSDEETEVTAETDADVEVTIDEEVTLGNFTKKLEKIEASLAKFDTQTVPDSARQGKEGAINNRAEALRAQLDAVAPLLEELEDLEGEEAEKAADALKELYAGLDNLQGQLDVQKTYVKKISDEATDEEVLAEYEELATILKKMGKKGVLTFVNGEEPEMDVQPVIEENRVLLPFRALAEALDAEVKYDAELKTVTVTKGDVSVVLTIDSKTAKVNNQIVLLDVPAKAKKGRTLIPLRFLSQSLNAKVLWEAKTQTAIVLEEETAINQDEAVNQDEAINEEDVAVEKQ